MFSSIAIQGQIRLYMRHLFRGGLKRSHRVGRGASASGPLKKIAPSTSLRRGASRYPVGQVASPSATRLTLRPADPSTHTAEQILQSVLRPRRRGLVDVSGICLCESASPLRYRSSSAVSIIALDTWLAGVMMRRMNRANASSDPALRLLVLDRRDDSRNMAR